MAEQRYVYLGDRLTDSIHKRRICTAIKINGKCIRGKNGNMLIQFQDGSTCVVIARLLRKLKETDPV